VKERREKEEIVMLKPKSVAPLGDSPFAEDDALGAPPKGVADEGPFFKAVRHDERISWRGWGMTEMKW
jgi:hypothetical protein